MMKRSSLTYASKLMTGLMLTARQLGQWKRAPVNTARNGNRSPVNSGRQLGQWKPGLTPVTASHLSQVRAANCDFILGWCSTEDRHTSSSSSPSAAAAAAACIYDSTVRGVSTQYERWCISKSVETTKLLDNKSKAKERLSLTSDLFSKFYVSTATRKGLKETRQ